MGEVWDDILEYYHQHAAGKMRHTYMAIKTFIDPQKANQNFPRLKGQGSEIKGVLPFGDR
jgi:hypothetical protein